MKEKNLEKGGNKNWTKKETRRKSIHRMKINVKRNDRIKKNRNKRGRKKKQKRKIETVPKNKSKI